MTGRDNGQQLWDHKCHTQKFLFSFGGFNFSIAPERCLEVGIRDDNLFP